MASILKELRRRCIEHGKKNRSCVGCPFYTVQNCKLKNVPAEWDLEDIQKSLQYIRSKQKYE